VLEFEVYGNYLRQTSIIVPERKLSKLASGVYYMVLTAKSNDNEKAKSAIQLLVISR